ncbi:MAG: DUF975 family protein [Suilimivivens sp.]
MWSRSELKKRAKEILRVNYWKAVLVSLIFSFVSGNGGGSGSSASSSGSSSNSSGSGSFSSPEDLKIFLAALSAVLVIVLIIVAVGIVLSIFVFAPLQVGCQRYFLMCGREPATINEVVFAFSNSYMNVVKVMFFKNLYTFLWSLLFVIPGIIKSYEYRMIPYLLAENPGLDMKEAFALTKQMMDGDKANAWVLDLSFIGWAILGALTCCILNIFYVCPYQNLTNAQLYEVLKRKISGPANGGTYQDPYTNTGSLSDGSNSNPYL